MKKDYTHFSHDVESLLNGSETDLSSLSEEWTHEPADETILSHRKYDSEEAFSRFKAEAYPKKTIWMRNWHALAGAAASAVIIFCIGFSYYFHTPSQPSVIDNIALVPAVNDSLPQIVLANGSKTGVADGITVSGIKVKVNGSDIVLTEDEAVAEAQPVMEEIVIPRGRMYKLELTDGSKVLLNSESSIRFPNHFTDKRNVSLTGEAFFEVKKDGRPFLVTTGRGTISVLGTTFSVSAYRNRPFTVALKTGKIRFHNGKSDEILTPGQSITCEEDGTAIVTSAPKTTDTAWMDGIISFDNASLEDIMDDIVRMYDVRVHYLTDEMRHITFTGECSRFKEVGEFMEVMGLTDEFDFEIVGRDIYIRNKENKN